MSPPQLCTINVASTSQSGNRYLTAEGSFSPTSGIDNYIPADNLQLGPSQWAYSVFLTDTDEGLNQRFNSLVKRWKRETIHFSLIQQMVLHPAYQEIIGLGPKVVPLILRELEKEPDFWFWALRAVTGEDPTTKEMRGDLQAMTKAWLNWGYGHAYL